MKIKDTQRKVKLIASKRFTELIIKKEKNKIP